MHVWKGELCWNYVHLVRKIIILCTFGKENCAEITYIW